MGEAIKKRLKNSKIVHVDDYWDKSLTIPSSFSKWRKWELPSSIDFRKMHKDLIQLKYKNKHHTIIVEGNLLFYYKKIRDILDLKIYLEIPNKLVVDRRIKKFGHKDNQKKYSKEIVVKEYKRFGVPLKKYADLIFSGTEPASSTVKKVINCILKEREKRT